jgi:hypothetical protein
LIDEQLGRILFDRILSRGGAVEPVPSLPATKGSFPKLLCLDLNHWIALARANAGKDASEGVRTALDAIRRARSLKKLVLAMTVENVIEGTFGENSSKRKSLMEFMIRESDNFTVMNGQVVKNWEIVAGAAAVLRLG